MVRCHTKTLCCVTFLLSQSKWGKRALSAMYDAIDGSKAPLVPPPDLAAAGGVGNEKPSAAGAQKQAEQDDEVIGVCEAGGCNDAAKLTCEICKALFLPLKASTVI